MGLEKEIIDQETGEVIYGNPKFVQMNERNMDSLITLIKENSMAGQIFIWISKRMNKSNALVVSQQTLAETLDISRQSVYTSIKFLRDNNYLTILKSGNTNVYVLNERIVWKAEADKRRFAQFSAEVYLGETEQEMEFKEKTTHSKEINLK